MGRKQKPLARPGERKQQTRKGLEIPVPSRDSFFGSLDKAATKKPPKRREKESH
jgi:hypothetical protein